MDQISGLLYLVTDENWMDPSPFPDYDKIDSPRSSVYPPAIR